MIFFLLNFTSFPVTRIRARDISRYRLSRFRLHAWGDTLKEAFEQCAMAMFGYMTDLDRVQIAQVHHVEAEGHDLESLLFHFLDELLFMFSAEPYIVAKV